MKLLNIQPRRCTIEKYFTSWDPVSTVLWAIALVLILAPIAVSYESYRPAWDEMYFLHRAVCVNRTIYDLNLGGLDQCLREMSKSPIMAGLLTLFGNIEGTFTKLGLATATLSLLCFSQILLILTLANAMHTSRILTLIAAAAAVIAQPIAEASAPFMVDGLLSLLIVVMFFLVVLEIDSTPQTPSPAKWVGRGLTWGWVLGLGILCKITFLYFAGLAGCLALFLSLRFGGIRVTLWKFLGLCISLLIPLVIFSRYLGNYMAHASGAAFGNLSNFYDDGLDRWAYLETTLPSIGWGYWLLIAVLFVFVILRPVSYARQAVAAYCILILLGYLLISAGSPNKDPRFFWPLWVALPFCLASAGQIGRPKTEPKPIGFPAAWAAVVSLSLVIPTAIRLDLRDVTNARAVMETLPKNRSIKVLLASDEPTFNIETMLLARELNYESLALLRLDTVVYDIVRGKTREQSLEKLKAAEVVILRDPPDPGAPDWANQHQPFFAEQLRASCSIQDKIGETTYVFRDC